MSNLDKALKALRESGAPYVIGRKGEPLGVLLTLEEYDHYLDLLDDEADCQDEELAGRLEQAATHAQHGERQTFEDYLRNRHESDGEVHG